MSPDLENNLRERYPDLLDADCSIGVGDGWATIISGMLEEIRGLVGDGHCKLLSITSRSGALHVDFRAAKLDWLTASRIKAQVTRARWHGYRTPENA